MRPRIKNNAKETGQRQKGTGQARSITTDEKRVDQIQQKQENTKYYFQVEQPEKL